MKRAGMDAAHAVRTALCRIRLVLAAALLAGIFAGCSSGRQEDEAYSDIDFTVTAFEQLPEELSAIIEENRKDEIRMTYMDGADMYLIRGYGEQKSGGYSIAVVKCAENEEEIRFETRLIGPQSRENLPEEPSCPCLVVKIEARDKTVMID